MSRTKEPDIARLNNVRLYSSNTNQALEQLIRDVSELYVFGYSNEKIKSLDKVKSAVNRVKSLAVANGDAGKIPSVEKLVDYIFLNDEAKNVLGLWNKFDYMFPLQVLDYSKHLIEQKLLKRINHFKLASLLFAIMSFHKIKSSSSVRNIITKMQSIETPSEANIELLIELQNNREDALIIEKPSALQQLAGIDVDSVEKYAEEILGLRYRSHKYSIANKEYKSRRIIFGVTQLSQGLEAFIEEREDIYSVLNNRIQNKLESGIVSTEINQLYQKYERKFMRDRTTYFNIAHLKDNPFIRIEREGNGFNCYTQFSLSNYKFIFDSLYKFEDSFKSPLNSYLNLRTLNALAKKKVESNIIDSIHQKLIETGIAKKPVDSQFLGKDINSNHFKQISEVTPIILKISNTGIMIDSNRLKIVKDKYEEAYKNSIESNDIKASRKYKTYLKDIDKIRKGMSSAKNDFLGTENRIFGYFTPSGAATHRMTCSKLALHAFPKEVMCEIMTAPKGKVLVSLDVSGQDITVTLNLAKRFYAEDHSFEDLDDRADFQYFSEYIEETFDTMKSEQFSRPIDVIAKLLFEEFSPHYKYDDIRGFVKGSIYTKFYGGGLQTVTDKVKKKKSYQDSQVIALEFIKDEIKQFLDIADGLDVVPPLYRRVENLLLQILELSTFDELNKSAQKLVKPIQKLLTYLHKHGSTEIRDFILRCGILKIHLSNVYLRELPVKIDAAEEKEVPANMFLKVFEIIKYYYPGLLESLEFYEKYYEENNKTYPTLLGWSTIVELSNNVGNMKTKSKSYPIQASGAEFIRQWILELAKVRNGYENQFRIVNAIHDQIIVETSTRHEAKIKDLLESSAKSAATKVGIDRDTLFFGKPEIVSNRWLNHEISCDNSL